MSLLYSAVFATRCRSTHHKIALDALRFLEGPDAARWRLLFLHFHQNYLKGAKAPDDVFKDYKNHVLHVREGDWGGAMEAAEEWRKRLARALRANDWSHAAWCAGVMSHYCVDPLQPFHTHQTEEENTIHRAVEWSYFKSYGQLRGLIERFGWPKVEPPTHDRWLADTVREGAKLSTQFYEFAIDHYNFEAGVKQPQRGLDNPLREAIAKLLGCAVISWARILEQVIAEAGAKPPRLDGALQGFFLTLEAPIQAVLGLIADVKERALLARQYEEYRKTGKVRTTLSEDDATVRALYAAEVLKLPLSSLDARWPREIGTAHDAKLKLTKRKKAEKAKKEGKKKEDKEKAKAPSVRPEAPAAEKTPPVASSAPAPAAAAAGSSFFDPGAPRPAQATPPPQEPVAPKAKPREPSGEAAPLLLTKKVKPLRRPSDDPDALRFSLYGDSALADAPSIGPKTARRFYGVGIRTVSELLAISPAAAAVLINVRRITAPLIHDWQAQAMLACTVPELRSREAQALVACDIRDAEGLAEADAPKLAATMREWRQNRDPGLAAGEAEPFSDADVTGLIERAKKALAAGPKSPAFA